MRKCPDHVLLITPTPFPSEDPLHVVLRTPGANTTRAPTRRDARRIMESGDAIDVIVCDLSLPDGNWSDVMRDVIASGTSACVVVRAAGADQRLWSEVLWRGAYDILVAPYSREEAQRTLEGATRATELLEQVRRPTAVAS